MLSLCWEILRLSSNFAPRQYFVRTSSSSNFSLLFKSFIFRIHYLKKRGIGPVLHPFDAFWHGSVSLQVVQVECLFAGAQDTGDGRAVAYGEADLHIDALCRPSVNVSCEEPVVLAGLKHVTHLVRPDGVEILVIAAHLLPLVYGCVRKGQGYKWEGRKRGDESPKWLMGLLRPDTN